MGFGGPRLASFFYYLFPSKGTPPTSKQRAREGVPRDQKGGKNDTGFTPILNRRNPVSHQPILSCLLVPIFYGICEDQTLPL